MAETLHDLGVRERRRLESPDCAGKPASVIVVARRRIALARLDGATEVMTVLTPHEAAVRALDPALTAPAQPVTPSLWDV